MPAQPTAEELILAGRAWRLAILTTADAEAARRTLSALPPPRPGEPLSADRIDRMAIQSLRRAVAPPRYAARSDRADPVAAGASAASARTRVDPVSLGAAHDVLASLPLQAAEAWTLRRLDDLDPIRACRAMDCSRSAADRYLARADSELARRLGDDHAEAVRALRAAADALAPDPHVIAICMERARHRARRRITLAIAICAITLSALLGVALATL